LYDANSQHASRRVEKWLEFNVMSLVVTQASDCLSSSPTEW
jgi:hypothetical protein